ncbi:MAG: D-aminoacyl-tRNA deacylase [Rhodobacteraceae bacterium]|nr:D-aminoacyl-tRNA deacylase [Paracoccaceae bacterium]
MRSLVQRVTSASVHINGAPHCQINAGLLVLVCAMHGDTENSVIKMAQKLTRLRIFEDDAGKMNHSVRDIGGEILAVSQFTLAASTDRGNRPSFINAAAPGDALQLYTHFINCLEQTGLTVRSGRFGATMQVSLVNDGPVTIWLES